jgi:hypothetical protein
MRNVFALYEQLASVYPQHDPDTVCPDMVCPDMVSSHNDLLKPDNIFRNLLDNRLITTN